MFVAATSGVDARHQGIASAMASTTQQIGSAVGLAVLVAIANAAVHTTTGPDLVPGLRTAGFTAAALTLLGVGIALTLRRSGSTPPAAAAAETPQKTGSAISARAPCAENTQTSSAGRPPRR
ncbi:hypothetical protein ACFRCI_18995 [Streptomyces sp. NPDC056638]|uniref:hypothetical protein n=1 Tax=Streptomyces sp. NPDC056638 TaxID=3345887 RepID=UPI00369E7C67